LSAGHEWKQTEQEIGFLHIELPLDVISQLKQTKKLKSGSLLTGNQMLRN